MLQHYGPRLKALHFRTDQALTAALSEMELTAAQGQIMGYISHQQDPPCPRDIEEVFRLSHPTVSGLLSRLEKKEFIAIHPDARDKRCKRITLLPKGEACCHKMQQIIQATEDQMVQNFSPEEKATLRCLLDKAIDNMGGVCCRPFQKEES